jgi:secreted Zn-dependent insulinase-like peptidase
MLAQITKELVYNCLRTKEQLGYTVFSSVKRFDATMSFRVDIQSKKHPALLDGQIEKFLASFARTLADMSCADFETHKRSCINSLWGQTWTSKMNHGNCGRVSTTKSTSLTRVSDIHAT